MTYDEAFALLRKYNSEPFHITHALTVSNVMRRFSGGVDSAYLLYAATRYAARVKAYCVSTAFQPAFELADARRLADEVGADMQVLQRRNATRFARSVSAVTSL